MHFKNQNPSFVKLLIPNLKFRKIKNYKYLLIKALTEFKSENNLNH